MDKLKKYVSFIITLVILTTSCLTAFADATKFTDVNNESKYGKYILDLAEKGAEETYEIIEKENVYAALQANISSADRQLFFVLRPSQINK